MVEISLMEIEGLVDVKWELKSIAKSEKDKELIEQLMSALDGKLRMMYQDNEHHNQTVNKHIMRCVKIAREKKSGTFMQIVAYLHDLGKVLPDGYNDYEEKEDGMIYAKHFFKHPKKSIEIAKVFFECIDISYEWRKDIIFIIENHENRFETLKSAGKLLKKADGDFRLLELLVEFQEIDILAQSENVREEKLAINRHSKELIEELKEEEAKGKDVVLAINGKNIALKGYKGKEIGDKIAELKRLVKSGKVANTKEDLMKIL